MNTNTKIRWVWVFATGLLCGIVIAVVYYQVLCLLDAKRRSKKPMAEAIGFYTWDLSDFYAPGSIEAKRLAEQFPEDIRNLQTDRPVYFRLPAPNGTRDAGTVLAWDFKLTDEMLKEWQKKIRANKPFERTRP